MEDLRHEAQLVAEDHMAKALATIMYASVVSRVTVEKTFVIAACNGLS